MMARIGLREIIRWSSRALSPVCPDNNFVNVWKRLWYIDTLIHWLYGVLPVISSLASKNLHPASDGRCKECSCVWYCQTRLDMPIFCRRGFSFFSVQHNQENMDTPRFTPEIYKDKGDMLVYEDEWPFIIWIGSRWEWVLGKFREPVHISLFFCLQKSDSNSKMPHLWNLPKKRLIMPGSTIRSVQVDLFWGTRLTCYLFRHKIYKNCLKDVLTPLLPQ